MVWIRQSEIARDSESGRSRYRKVKAESFTHGEPYGPGRYPLHETSGNLSDEMILDSVREFLRERALGHPVVREFHIMFAEDSAL